ncbi:(2Fe-2S)-binding protein [Sinomicrobium kalidii]|uniref:(2Fe-2S)-binding protein n=1 Tax=Sinomicrobium kalidii TaxID=2900738 RepID=UPI001E4876B2|nr:(2Fe-2S)-binding protein [Sinomicrobium kalidii]UGU15453.1 (2Fe-2S)-binding protein [Sinomicrobium kalidii]
MTKISFKINGEKVTVNAKPDTPVLWIIREHLGLTGTKYGCGRSICGACTVHLDGNPVRACVTPLSLIEGTDITTIEGLSDDGTHPLQEAWIDEQVPQCGYCQSGQIMQAAVLLKKNKNPNRKEIIDHMNGNLCRCGAYLRILKAIEAVAKKDNYE